LLLLGEQRAPHSSPYAAASIALPNPAIPATGTGAQRQHLAARTQDAEPVDLVKTDFSIRKSRSYRAVGPLRVRLLKIRKNAACDIAVLVNGKRTEKLGATVGTTIKLEVPESASPATLVLTRITRTRVAGFVLAHKSPTQVPALPRSAQRAGQE
jgi:hypothetical protein